MDTRRTRTASVVAALTAGALALSACGDSASDEPDAAGGSTDGKTTITVALFGTFGYEESGLFEQYMEENPDILIQYESTQGEDKYWPALQTKLNSGSGTADIQGIEVARISEVTANQADLWTDLRDTPAGERVEDYVDWKANAATTADGKVLGLGTDIGPMALCYRSDLFEEAGLPSEPDELAARLGSWEDFITLGEEFQAGAPEGTAFHDSAGGLYNAIVSTEEQIYHDESGELVLESNQALRDAFDLAARAGQSGLTAKLEQFVDPSWDGGFGSGTFASIACPSWMIGYIKGKAGDAGSGQWNITTLPGGQGGNWGGAYLAIPEASENKEEAAELIAWLTDAEQQAAVFSNVGNFPSNTGAIELVGDTTDEYFNGAPIGQVFTTSAQNAPTQILGPYDGVAKNAMVQALLSVEVNGVDPADAWETGVSQVLNQVR
ncbi:extracellular solute-binding protein [Georgenia wutianyii]|uniref:Extracellular solute-binding protein n=1 Tax=Georgenia wutianyii TaxID=2585135 RepID=A0ABX5VJG1_9MICO|nr:extracellular solute-binding protein [Georgenia wutianyii]QDB78562.1 extracellular solute-binding protein [Georgenia wutianyii]